MIIHDHWSCWSCMKFVDHAMIRYWSCMKSVDHAMKGCWSCMKSVDHAMKGCWSYMMINDHCHERLLIIHDQHWSVYHIVTTTWPVWPAVCTNHWWLYPVTHPMIYVTRKLMSTNLAFIAHQIFLHWSTYLLTAAVTLLFLYHIFVLLLRNQNNRLTHYPRANTLSKG